MRGERNRVIFHSLWTIPLLNQYHHKKKQLLSIISSQQIVLLVLASETMTIFVITPAKYNKLVALPADTWWNEKRAGNNVSYIRGDSKRSKHLFIATPPLKPPRLPSLPITRWQGITMGNGFLFKACPTALAALTTPD